MYKVFVNDKPIIITSSKKKLNDFPFYNFTNISFDKVIQKLQKKNIHGIKLYTSNLEKDWASFLQNMEVLTAAGGLVLNPKNEILLIYRNNVWDLPKGKVEKSESIDSAAIREVEEECGIFNLSILKKLITTYHIYFQNGTKLKKTHWFLMASDYNKKLIPQIEEGITKVVFKNEVETDEILKNSYANIKLVYHAFKDKVVL